MARQPKTPINGDLRQAVFDRDGKRCRYCGSKRGPFQVDHVYPESKGGETTLENLVVACKRCNADKHAKIGIWPRERNYQERLDRLDNALGDMRQKHHSVSQRLNAPLPSIFGILFFVGVLLSFPYAIGIGRESEIMTALFWGGIVAVMLSMVGGLEWWVKQ